MSNYVEHSHQWDVTFKEEANVSCNICGYIIDTSPLTSNELIRAVYTSTGNIYHTICFQSDSGGPQQVSSFDLEQRLIALDILTTKHYPQEVNKIKDALRSLYAELKDVEYFRIFEANVMTTNGCHLDIALGLDLRAHDALIVKALEEFSYTILGEDGYPESEAKTYLALQTPAIVFESYLDKISY
jgi:hypothetical protein